MLFKKDDLIIYSSSKIFNLIEDKIKNIYYANYDFFSNYNYFVLFVKNEISITKNLYSEETDYISFIESRINKKIELSDSNNIVSCINLYLQDIRKYDVLTKEQERELFVRYRNGDINAKNDLIKHNLRLVYSVAIKYSKKDVDLQDLIQEGTLGLYSAIEKFDVSRDCKFSTYAIYWIKQSILDFAYSNSKIVKIPGYKVYQYKKMIKKKNDLQQKLKRELTDEEIEKYLDIPIKKYNDLVIAMDKNISIYTKINDDDDIELIDYIGSSDNTEEQSINNFMIDDVNKLLNDAKLSDREKDIIISRYGIGNKKEISLNALGEKYNISRERARQIEMTALKKLAKKALSRNLDSYLDSKKENYTRIDIIKENIDKLKENCNFLPQEVIDYFIESKLSLIEINVLILCLGLNKEKEKNVEEISRILNKSVKNITIIEKNAFLKLKNTKSRKYYLDYLDSINSKKYNNYINIKESLKKEDNKEIFDKIEKILENPLIVFLNNFIQKEDIIIFILNIGLVDDSVYSIDYIAKMFNIDLEYTINSYKETLKTVKNMGYLDLLLSINENDNKKLTKK